MNLETKCAIDAYKEEFTYFAYEGEQGAFIDLARDLFVENHGKAEADCVAWQYVCGYFAAIKRELNER